MVHRKAVSIGGRNSVYTYDRRGTLMAGQASSSSHLPLRHSSPVRQPIKPLRKIPWGNGGHHGQFDGHFDERDDRSSPYFCHPRDTKSLLLNDNFGNFNKSSASTSIDSDGGSSSNSAHSKSSSSGSSKKTVGRPSNPLRYKTELCRSYEESGECRFGPSCTFAHGERERRRVLRHPRYKTDLCRTYHGAGYCQYGARCHFIHDPEEAAGFAGMTGHKLRTCLDGSNMTMLANLQRLYFYKLVEEKYGFLNTSGLGSDQLNFMAAPLKSNSVSLDILSIPQDNFPGMTSKSQPLENECGSPPNISESILANISSPRRGNDQIWRLPPLGCNWLDREPEYCKQNSVSDLNAMDFSSGPPSSNTWNLCGVSTVKKSVIGNPMEVSRSLLLPSFSDLIQMS